MMYKPFNPLLGETYEWITDDFQYLSEKVSHHPPVCAVYVRGANFRIDMCYGQTTNLFMTGSMKIA